MRTRSLLTWIVAASLLPGCGGDRPAQQGPEAPKAVVEASVAPKKSTYRERLAEFKEAVEKGRISEARGECGAMAPGRSQGLVFCAR